MPEANANNETASHPGYKMSEVGEIPQNWDIKHLNDVVQIIMGQSPPSTTYNETGDGLPFLQGNVDFGEKFPTKRIYCSKPAKTSQPDDILLTVRAPVGEVNVAQEPYCIGRGVSILRPKDVNADFLYFYLLMAGWYWQRIQQGSTFESINRVHLATLPIPLPTLPEQHKIAAILSTVDENIQKTQQIIEKTEELKKGLMQKLLTRGIGHTKFKKTEIGEIPEEWEVKRLGDLWSFCKAGISRPFESEPIGISVLRSNNVRDGHIDLIELKYWYTPDTRGYDLSKVTLRKYDVLVNFVNGSLKELGKAGIYLEEVTPCIVSTNFFILRFREGVNPFFVNLFLQTHKYKKQIDAIGGFTGQGSFDTDDLARVVLPLPAVSEQKKVVQTLLEIENKSKSEQERRLQLEQLKKGLMQVLLTGKVRVKVEQAEAKT